MSRPRFAIALAPLCAALLVGCAAKQTISLDAGPRPLEVYVDGRLAPDPAEQVELEPDRDHTLYFKKPGHHSELVVLESRPQGEGERRRLEPAEVEVRLRPRDGE